MHLHECKGRCTPKLSQQCSRTSDGTQNTRLIALPFELRQKILFYLLCSEKSISIYHQKGSYRLNSSPLYHEAAKTERLRSSLSILYTCRQIAREAADVLYGQNVIGLIDPPLPALWLDEIGPTNKRALRKISLTYSEYHGTRVERLIPPLRTGLAMLARLKELRTVELRFSRFAIPYLHQIARSMRAMHSFRIIAEDHQSHWQEDVTWAVEKAEPWGWDFEQKRWRKYEEIMTRELRTRRF